MQRAFGYVILIVACRPLGIMSGEDRAVSAPQDVIGKAIEAHGGKKNLAAFSNFRARFRGSFFDDERSVPVTAQYLYRAPKSYRLITEIQSPASGLIRETAVFDGKNIWIKSNGRTQEGSQAELSLARNSAYATHVKRLYHLLDKDRFTLSALPPCRINRKDAAGVRVSSKGHPDVDLFFDVKTWLLVKVQFRSEVGPGNVSMLEESYYQEYKRREGVMCATKKKQVINGKKRSELELVDVEILTEVEESDFSKP